jgi:hypothetical protein
MADEPCKSLREKYDACFQRWIDNEYFKGKVTAPMIPCKDDINEFHDCIRRDSKLAVYLEKLEEYKQQFPLE